jgi:methylated-DNA-[protein]-cysteine S-methyltransferase
MTKPEACRRVEPDLIAAAIGEAVPPVDERVAAHLAGCEACRDEYARYRTIDGLVSELRTVPAPPGDAARGRLLARLADLRSRLVRYGVFPTSLGPLLIATTEQGVVLVEYVGRRDGSDAWLLRQRGVEPAADPVPLRRLHAELLDYLAGRVTRLEWPLDLRFVRSDFQREVLEATARVPYGAVSSYAGIASDIGRPRAVRAVAGALRRNPVPIVVPCHRIVGSGGALVGYAGTRIGLKERLLGVEGVRIGHRRRTAEVDRGAMYAWYRRDRAYCLPTCGAISEQPIGAVTLFASAREAEALGLAPCGDCRPDLHPLRPSAVSRRP